MRWTEGDDHAFFCIHCLTVVIPYESCYWVCNCQDIGTLFGFPWAMETTENRPERWIKGKIAFFPWPSVDERNM